MSVLEEFSTEINQIERCTTTVVSRSTKFTTSSSNNNNNNSCIMQMSDEKRSTVVDKEETDASYNRNLVSNGLYRISSPTYNNVVVESEQNTVTTNNINNMPKSTVSSMNGSTVMDDKYFQGTSQTNGIQKSISSMISFNSSVEGDGESTRPYEFVSHKMEVVYNLLTLLESHDKLASSQTLLTMSQELESCQLIRQSGCLTLLIQLLHSTDVSSCAPKKEEFDVISRSTEALRNVVRYQTDDLHKMRELRILQQLELIRSYVLRLRLINFSCQGKQPVQEEEVVVNAMGLLWRFSYDEDDRLATFSLGGLQAIAETLIMDQMVYGLSCSNSRVDLRRLVGMTLTNLTYGAAQSKEILCCCPKFLDSVNSQFDLRVGELISVFASLLRNLSWKANEKCKKELRKASTVTVLMKAAMQVKKENILKSVLSALWNFSHLLTDNKIDICNVPGAIEFLLSTLNCDASTAQNTAILESGSGILRNISSQIAVNEEYREILRRNNCFEILLRHLQSTSLTVVSNSCGTLWNLSARNVQDQKTLIDMGAVPMLRNLIHSKHKMIAVSSAATLKNLHGGSGGRSAGDELPSSASSSILMPSRHQYRPLDFDIDENLSDFNMFNNRDFVFLPSSNTAASGQVSRETSHQQQQRQEQSPNKVPRGNGAPYLRNYGIDVMKSSSVSNCSAASLTAGQQQQRSKVEQLQMDRSKTQRFHNSFRRSQNQTQRCVVDKDATSAASSDACVDGSDETLRSYCVESGGVADASASMSRRRFIVEDGNNSMSVSGCVETHVSTRASTSSYMYDEDASEKVKSYAVEGGTPAHLSLGSSLNDLRISMENKDSSGSKNSRTPNSSAANKNNASVARQQRDSSSKQATAAQTPMMFSRNSSLQSLDSCDQQSVRSTVYSEYSQQPTGLHSPSELPDSPTHTMPRPLNTILVGNHGNGNTVVVSPPVGSDTVFRPTVVPIVNLKPLQQQHRASDFFGVDTASVCSSTERPRVYSTEIAPTHSDASSLSGLTFDKDEDRVKPCQSGRRVAPLLPNDYGAAARNKSDGNSAGYQSPQFKVPLGIPPRKPASAKQQQHSSAAVPFSGKMSPMESADFDLGPRVDPIGIENNDSSSSAPDYLSTVMDIALPKRKPPKLSNANKKTAATAPAAQPSGIKNPTSVNLVNYRGKNVGIAKPMVCDVSGGGISSLNRECQSQDHKNPQHYVAVSPFPSTSSFYNSSRDEEQQDIRVYATELTPGASLRSSFNNLYIKGSGKDDEPSSGKMRGTPCASSSKQSTAAQSPKSLRNFDYFDGNGPPSAQHPVHQHQQNNNPSSRKERSEVDECIYSALPKPKNRQQSKSLDRKSQRRRLVVASGGAGDSRTRHSKDSAPYSDSYSPSSTDTVTAASIRNDIRATDRKTNSHSDLAVGNAPKGILETSDISLVDEDEQSSSIMKMSTCSNLVKTISTCEKIKDGTSLLLSQQPPQHVSPVKRSPAAEHPAGGFYPPPSPLPHVKSSSDETNESLSEDNYSRIEDEQFDANVDDIDLDLLTASAENGNSFTDSLTNADNSPRHSNHHHHHVVHFENDNSRATLDEQLLSPREFLIDCDVLSLTSNATSTTATKSQSCTTWRSNTLDRPTAGGDDSSRKKSSPKILMKIQSSSEVSLAEAKKIRGGGGRKMLSNKTYDLSSAPKLAVRTTKTAELRAKKASETCERLRTTSGGSRSASPGTPRKWSSSSPRTSDADITEGRFSRNTFERRSRQSTSSGEVNVASWPRASADKSPSSVGTVKNCTTLPFLKIDSPYNNSVKTRPLVPPKPSKLGRQSPCGAGGATENVSGRKSLGKQVGSKIASLWKKDDFQDELSCVVVQPFNYVQPSSAKNPPSKSGGHKNSLDYSSSNGSLGGGGRDGSACCDNSKPSKIAPSAKSGLQQPTDCKKNAKSNKDTVVIDSQVVDSSKNNNSSSKRMLVTTV